MAEPGTYREDVQQDGRTRYVCMIPYATQPDGICGHWSTDFTLFKQHMEQQHMGELVKAGEPPDHPHGTPPGQDPDFVPPGQGGTPPGQDKPDKPDEEEDVPHPEHPIVDPTQPVPTPHAPGA